MHRAKEMVFVDWCSESTWDACILGFSCGNFHHLSPQANLLFAAHPHFQHAAATFFPAVPDSFGGCVSMCLCNSRRVHPAKLFQEILFLLLR